MHAWNCGPIALAGSRRERPRVFQQPPKEGLDNRHGNNHHQVGYVSLNSRPREALENHPGAKPHEDRAMSLTPPEDPCAELPRPSLGPEGHQSPRDSPAYAWRTGAQRCCPSPSSAPTLIPACVTTKRHSESFQQRDRSKPPKPISGNLFNPTAINQSRLKRPQRPDVPIDRNKQPANHQT